LQQILVSIKKITSVTTLEQMTGSLLNSVGTPRIL